MVYHLASTCKVPFSKIYVLLKVYDQLKSHMNYTHAYSFNLHPHLGYVWLGSHVREKSRRDYLFVRIRENMIENS